MIQRFSDQAAFERTYLAWMRAAIAIMALRTPGRLVFLCIAGLMGGIACSGARPPASAGSEAENVEIGGSYSELAADQQRLIDGFLARYNEIRGTNLDATAYDELPFSVRTTFQAVTHALRNTPLTDPNGDELGTALALVAAVEMVHGQIIGAGGDEQFRIYVRLRDDALATLEASREFPRDSDNTFFHTDYPINYRQRGTPSIQFSIAADGRRADIDVDYRSTQFPMVLFDGHLSVANSRWQGLFAWWRNLFGLHREVDSPDDTAPANFLSPLEGTPRISDDADVQVAIEDFMSAWLIERDPRVAMTYLSEPALNCVRDLDPGTPTDDLAAVRILTRMEQMLDQIARVESLGEIVRPVPVPHQGMRAINQDHGDLFAMVDVPPTLAAALLCAGGDTWRSAARVHNRRPYRGASLAVSAIDGTVLDLFLLWSHEAGFWKIIAVHVDGRPSAESILALEPADAEDSPSPVVSSGRTDPGFASVVDGYLSAWFLEHDYDRLRDYYSPRAYACAEVLHPEQPVSRNADEAWRQLRSSFVEIAAAVSRPGALADEIAAVHPWNPDLRLLEHADPAAYTLLEVPNHLAASFECSNRAAGRYHEPLVGQPQHGRYRAVVFRLLLAGDLGPAFLTLWEQDGEDWKIVSFATIGH